VDDASGGCFGQHLLSALVIGGEVGFTQGNPTGQKVGFEQREIALHFRDARESLVAATSVRLEGPLLPGAATTARTQLTVVHLPNTFPSGAPPLLSRAVHSGEWIGPYPDGAYRSIRASRPLDRPAVPLAHARQSDATFQDCR
jgi:hypothetical protein